MTTAELVAESKKSLNIPEDATAFDAVLAQKVLAVKGYLAGAGVSTEQMDTDAGIGVIVMGVADLWTIRGGETKFSPAFTIMASQLAAASLE